MDTALPEAARPDHTAPHPRGRWLRVARLAQSARLGRLARLALAKRFMQFVAVGVTGVVINSAALALHYQVARVPLVVASVLAVELAIVNNFVWNDRWTFARARLALGRFVRFHLVSLGGLAITTSTLWLLVRFTGVQYLIANGAGIMLATLWNYQANRFWTWRSAER